MLDVAVIGDPAVAEVALDPMRAKLLAIAARLVRDVRALITDAARARKRVATFTLDGELRFASVAGRAALTEEVAAAVTALVSTYHDETAEGGRDHRVVAIHPSVKSSECAKRAKDLT